MPTYSIVVNLATSASNMYSQMSAAPPYTTQDLTGSSAVLISAKNQSVSSKSINSVVTPTGTSFLIQSSPVSLYGIAIGAATWDGLDSSNNYVGTVAEIREGRFSLPLPFTSVETVTSASLTVLGSSLPNGGTYFANKPNWVLELSDIDYTKFNPDPKLLFNNTNPTLQASAVYASVGGALISSTVPAVVASGQNFINLLNNKRGLDRINTIMSTSAIRLDTFAGLYRQRSDDYTASTNGDGVYFIKSATLNVVTKIDPYGWGQGGIYSGSNVKSSVPTPLGSPSVQLVLQGASGNYFYTNAVDYNLSSLRGFANYSNNNIAINSFSINVGDYTSTPQVNDLLVATVLTRMPVGSGSGVLTPSGWNFFNSSSISDPSSYNSYVNVFYKFALGTTADNVTFNQVNSSSGVMIASINAFSNAYGLSSTIVSNWNLPAISIKAMVSNYSIPFNNIIRLTQNNAGNYAINSTLTSINATSSAGSIPSAALAVFCSPAGTLLSSASATNIQNDIALNYYVVPTQNPIKTSYKAQRYVNLTSQGSQSGQSIFGVATACPNFNIYNSITDGFGQVLNSATNTFTNVASATYKQFAYSWSGFNPDYLITDNFIIPINSNNPIGGFRINDNNPQNLTASVVSNGSLVYTAHRNATPYNSKISGAYFPATGFHDLSPSTSYYFMYGTYDNGSSSTTASPLYSTYYQFTTAASATTKNIIVMTGHYTNNTSVTDIITDVSFSSDGLSYSIPFSADVLSTPGFFGRLPLISNGTSGMSKGSKIIGSGTLIGLTNDSNGQVGDNGITNLTLFNFNSTPFSGTAVAGNNNLNYYYSGSIINSLAVNSLHPYSYGGLLISSTNKELYYPSIIKAGNNYIYSSFGLFVSDNCFVATSSAMSNTFVNVYNGYMGLNYISGSVIATGGVQYTAGQTTACAAIAISADNGNTWTEKLVIVDPLAGHTINFPSRMYKLNSGSFMFMSSSINVISFPRNEGYLSFTASSLNGPWNKKNVLSSGSNINTVTSNVQMGSDFQTNSGSVGFIANVNTPFTNTYRFKYVFYTIDGVSWASASVPPAGGFIDFAYSASLNKFFGIEYNAAYQASASVAIWSSSNLISWSSVAYKSNVTYDLARIIVR